MEIIDKECEIIKKQLKNYKGTIIDNVRDLQEKGLIRNNIKATSHLDNLYNRTI